MNFSNPFYAVLSVLSTVFREGFLKFCILMDEQKMKGIYRHYYKLFGMIKKKAIYLRMLLNMLSSALFFLPMMRYFYKENFSANRKAFLHLMYTNSDVPR